MDAPEVAKIFASLKSLRLAGNGKPDLHFYVDPHLAEAYTVNLHLIQAKNPENDSMERLAKTNTDFIEETISFPSKRKYEPEYVCSVMFHKPDDEVYSVSAYMVEKYLGQYAYKANFYFKKGSRGSALRCFERVLRATKDMKAEFMEKDLKQNEVPYHLKRALQGEAGEIEPRVNKMAIYLNPSNIKPSNTIGSENILTIPSHRSIKDDLDFEGKG